MSHPPYRTGTFAPHLSKPIAVFGVFSDLFLLMAIVLIIWSGLSVLQILVSVLVLVAMILYVTDVLFFTRYVLADGALIIYGQLRRLAIPYQEISKVKHGSLFSLVSMFRHKRHALSPHCLVVEIRQGPYGTVSLSPEHDREFQAALMHNLEIAAKLRHPHAR